MDCLHQLECNFLLLYSRFQVTYFLDEPLVVLFLDADFWDLLLSCRDILTFLLNCLVLQDLKDKFILIEHFVKVLKPLLEKFDLLDGLTKYQHNIGEFHLAELTAQPGKIDKVFVVAGFTCYSLEVVLDCSFKVLLVFISLSNHVADAPVSDMRLDLIQCLSRSGLPLLVALLWRLQKCFVLLCVLFKVMIELNPTAFFEGLKRCLVAELSRGVVFLVFREDVSQVVVAVCIVLVVAYGALV